jgi:hypothetical protein
LSGFASELRLGFLQTFNGVSAMRRLLGLGLVLGLAAAAAATAEHYGAPITLKDPQSLEAAVQGLGDRAAADVLVQSKVAEVCEERGCWLGLESASGKLHVTFRNEAFFVPSSLVGKTVVVQGRLHKASTGYQLVATGLEVTT